MKKAAKIFVPVILAFLFVILNPLSFVTDVSLRAETAAPASEATWYTPQETDSQSLFIMENTTSAVLFEKEADKKRYPASTTKILTALIAIENCSMDEIVTFSEEAITLEEAATNIKAKAGEKMTFRDVLFGLLLASGNDCANAIAEHVAGSVPAFADMMNARAEQIGCTGSHFSNPHGLFAEDHYSTARDLALIAQEAFKNSTFVEVISQESYTASPTNMNDEPRKFKNWNLLINTDSEYYDSDVIGGKTGFLDEAGRCLVTFAQRDGFTVICVQLKGAYTGIFAEAKLLLDSVFDSFSMKNVSENERRFAKATKDAKVVLDPSAQVLTLRGVPFDRLESSLIFAEDLDLERKAELMLAANTEPGRSLYAVIDYAYAGHKLGSANIYLHAKLKTAPAAFTKVYAINPVFLIIFVVLIALFALTLSVQKQKKKPAGKSRPYPPSSAARRANVPPRKRPRP